MEKVCDGKKDGIRPMKTLICIDDTDQLDTPGTGHLAEALCDEIERQGLGTCSAISRHQLYVHEDIPYTSHNSAMCFEVGVPNESLNAVIALGSLFLQRKSAPGSDPGFCVAPLEQKLNFEMLTDFGLKAKRSVLTKTDAYCLARKLNIHLSEHGGTGQGVVGALAGVGLRLSGNDGRFRGWYHLGRAGECIDVKTLKTYPFIDAVRSETSETLSDDACVFLGGDQQKTVWQDARQVLLVQNMNGRALPRWTTLTKEQVKKY